MSDDQHAADHPSRCRGDDRARPGRGLARPAEQKRGGTLTIVRPTDPVSLDPHLETTGPGAWVYNNILEPLVIFDEKLQIKPVLAASYDQVGPTRIRFKLKPGIVPRRHPAQRRRRPVHLRPGVQGDATRPLGEFGRAERRGRGRPHGGHRHQRAVRPDDPLAGDGLRRHRVAHRRADGRRLHAGADRHGTLQVRRVEDQHARDHGAPRRLLGRQGAARPRGLQGRARGAPA